MLFRPRHRAQDIGGLQSLAEWFGLNADEINVSGEKSLKEITVYTCVKILSEALGKLPLKIYQDTSDGKKPGKHYLTSLLKYRPNPYMSAIDFWKTMETARNIHGNAYAWKDTQARTGKILGFYPLDSEKVKIIVDDVGLLSSKNKIWYVYTDGAGEQHKINPDDMLHFKGLTTNGLTGLSPIETLKGTIENGKAAGSFLNSAFKNGMTTSGIVQYVGELGPKEKEIFREHFEEMSSGLKNANRISLLPVGYTYQPIALKLTDAQFLENTKLTIQQLTAAFGIKLHQVNYLEKTSYASTSEANREFYVDTLMAILAVYEQELIYKCFTDAEIKEGFYMKFNADVILRADTKSRYEAYAQSIQNGFKTPNEIRALEEDEPMDGGDKLYLNGNMLPITMAGAAYQKGGEGNGE
jgi:HK97 family phage portal protein